MYSVLCTHYYLFNAMYSALYTRSYIRCTMYSVLCIQYYVFSTMYSVLCTQYYVFNTMYSIPYTLNMYNIVYVNLAVEYNIINKNTYLCIVYSVNNYTYLYPGHNINVYPSCMARRFCYYVWVYLYIRYYYHIIS